MSSWESQARSPKLAEIRITRGAWNDLQEKNRALEVRVSELELIVDEFGTAIENIQSYLEKISRKPE